MFVGGGWQADLLVLLSGIYLLFNGLPKRALKFALVYIVLKVILAVAPPGLGLLLVLLYMIAKMFPMIMIASALMHSSPSGILCAFERIHVPKSTLVMICVLIRFFPVLALEMKAIHDGIRARRIFPHWYTILRHPAMSYECYFMPLIVRCLKLSSELSASAELRGIECDCRRTSTHHVGLRAIDGFAVGAYVLLCAAIYATGVLLG